VVARLAVAAGTLVRLARRSFASLLALAGSALVSYGVWLTYRPAGFVVAGLLALLAAWEVHR
jgi:hypothetical protein